MSLSVNFNQDKYKTLDIAQLDTFFKMWKEEVFLEPSEEKTELVIPDREKLQYFFSEYKEARVPMEEEKALGMKVNVWKTANLGRYEVRNSKVLRWFLDMYEDHGQGSFFLKALYDSLGWDKSSFPFPSVYRATEECCPLGDESERVDIEIESDEMLLFIEVKIDALEGKEQLKRYHDVAKIKAGSREWKIIYLTKDGVVKYDQEDKQNLSDKEKIIGLSWTHFAKVLQKQIRQELRKNPNNRNNRSLWLAEQFVEHILTF